MIARLVVLLAFISCTIPDLLGQDSASYQRFRLIEINCLGNKLTKRKIILREVELKLDSLYTLDELAERIEKSEANLMRTKLFNFAELKPNYQSDSLFLDIELTERWYIWPLPVFELADPNVNVWWQTKDFNRANVGFNLEHHNFRGRAEKLSLKFKWGYNKQLGLSYNRPYINKAQTVGLSLSTSYRQRYEVNYATVNNERVPYAKIGSAVREDFQNKMDLYYRPGNRFTSYLTLWHNQTTVADSVRFREPFYFAGRERLRYAGASLLFIFDSRDLPSYPLKGYYTSLSISHPGINPNKKYNFNIWSGEASFNYYAPLTKHLYWASGISGGVLTYNELPYFFQSGFGISGNVRGYEVYFIEAQRYGILKNHLKYGLLQDREIKVPFVKNPSFGRVPFALFLGAYIDLAYSEDDIYKARNPLDRELLMGYGVGLDFVTYYDKVFRVEFSTNSFGQSRIYLHFKRAI